MKQLVEAWINTLKENTTIKSSTSEFDGAPRRERQLRNVKGNILEWGNKVLPKRADLEQESGGYGKPSTKRGFGIYPGKSLDYVPQSKRIKL